MSTQSHPQASEKEKFRGNSNLHDIPRVSKQKQFVEFAVQFVEFAVHFVVKGEVIFYILMQN